MEPNDDLKLRELLNEWPAPHVPPALEDRIAHARRGWWRGLLTGYIRIPVPVAVGLTVILLAGAWFSFRSGTLTRCLAISSPATELCQPNLKC